MNTQYKNNLTTVMQASKKYTDDKIEQALELLEDYDLSSDTISQTSTSATAPSDVRTASLIQVGGNSVKYAPSTASDSSVSKIKSIPLSTFTLGVDYVGGITYKAINLFDKTTALLGYQIDGSGNIFADENYMLSDYIEVKPSTLYSFYVNNVAFLTCFFDENKTIISGTAYTSNFTTTSSTKYIRFTALKTRLDAFMLVKGSNVPSTYVEYVGNFDGLRSAKVTSVVVRVDLWDSEWELGAYDSSGNKTTNNNVIRAKNKIEVEPNTTYYFECGTQNVTYRAVFWTSTDTLISSTSNQQVNNTFTTPSNAKYFAFNLDANYGNTYKNDVYIYNNLIQPITKQIPAEIQALEGYGENIDNSIYNYIDLISKKFIRQKDNSFSNGSWSGGGITINNSGNEVTLNGTSSGVFNSYNATISKTLTAGTYKVRVDSDKSYAIEDVRIDFRSGEYDIISSQTINSGTNIYTITTNSSFRVCIRIASGISLTNDKLYISNSIAPIETDISSYIDDSFKTFTTNDQYTDIEMVNEYGYDMPNKVEYFGSIKETLVEDITITNVGEQPQTIDLLDSDVSDGWSASASVFNYRDIRERKRHKVVGKIHLGDYNWNYNTTSGKERFSTNISDIKIPSNDDSTINLLINRPYTTVSFNTIKNTTTDFLIGVGQTGNIIIRDFNYTDTATFKQAMNGVYLYYELANEVIEDLDIPYDLHYLPLTSGGTVVFNNDNNQQCHNTIRYSIMEAKE